MGFTADAFEVAPDELPERRYPRLHTPDGPELDEEPPRRRTRSRSNRELDELRDEMADLREQNRRLERQVMKMRGNVRSRSEEVLSQPSSRRRRSDSVPTTPVTRTPELPPPVDVSHAPENGEQILDLVQGILAARTARDSAGNPISAAKIDGMYTVLASAKLASCSTEKAGQISDALRALKKLEASPQRKNGIDAAMKQVLSVVPEIQDFRIEGILSRIRAKQIQMRRVAYRSPAYNQLFDELTQDFRQLHFTGVSKMSWRKASRLLVNAQEIKSQTPISSTKDSYGEELDQRHVALNRLIAGLERNGANRTGFFNRPHRWLQQRSFAKARRRAEQAPI